MVDAFKHKVHQNGKHMKISSHINIHQDKVHPFSVDRNHAWFMCGPFSIVQWHDQVKFRAMALWCELKNSHVYLSTHGTINARAMSVHRGTYVMLRIPDQSVNAASRMVWHRV